MTGPDDAEHAEHAALVSRLACTGFALPGTLIERTARCGKPNCRCHADPPRLHGPYWQWTRKHQGKTVTVNLTPRQAARYQPWFDTARDLRNTLARIEALSLRIASRNENWPQNPD
jgi:hypothetical protein